jgi:type IV pilus assembly protein PilO
MALELPKDPAKRNRLFLGVLALVLLGAYWYFLHTGYTEEVETLERRVEQIEARNAQARARVPQSRELEERLDQFERHIVRLEQLVPRSEEVPQLLDQIHRRAEQVGVEIGRFAPGQTTTGEHYNRRVFEVRVLGSYHHIGQFLAEVGSLPRIITATDLALTTNNVRAAAMGTTLEASFRIQTYVLPDRPRPGDTAPAGV